MTGLMLLIAMQSPFLQVGDTWSVEQTARYLNETEGIDTTDVERLDYQVTGMERQDLLLRVSNRLVESRHAKDAVPAPAGLKPTERQVRLSGAGVLQSDEHTANPLRARLDRIQWTLMEPRKGLQWTRKWAARERLPGAEVRVKPGKDGTAAVSYKEEGPVHGIGTATYAPSSRILAKLSLTFTDFRPPGGASDVSVAVSQKLLDLNIKR